MYILFHCNDHLVERTRVAASLTNTCDTEAGQPARTDNAALASACSGSGLWQVANDDREGAGQDGRRQSFKDEYFAESSIGISILRELKEGDGCKPTR